jgi:hypothetical protein
MTPRTLIMEWLDARLPDAARAWLHASLAELQSATNDALYLTISLVSRKVGGKALSLGAAELCRADAARPGWNPGDWRLDQAVRVALLLSLERDPARLAGCLEQLCMTADLNELVAFYSALPIYPDPARYRTRAREGLRSNIRTLFTAVAHRNPYPAEQLPEAAWNQLVLKALFVGVPLWPVIGLDERNNPRLAAMLGDYARERRAAGRAVNPEIWRCIGPFARDRLLDELQQLYRTGTPPERAAAALALQAAPDPAARTLLDDDPALQQRLATGEVSWQRLAATG